MSTPGRPKGEYRSAQHEGSSASTPGRPKGEYRSAQHEGSSASTPGRPSLGFCSLILGGDELAGSSSLPGSNGTGTSPNGAVARPTAQVSPVTGQSVHRMCVHLSSFTVHSQWT